MKKRVWCLAMALAMVLTLSSFRMPTVVAAEPAWYAEYFANRDLAGGPTITRYESTLHFEWGTGGPGSGVPADGFSARWTRDEWFETGTYRFSYRSDDGIRIWVTDTLVVDDWRDRQAAWSSVDHFIPRGVHRVRVEYYEHTGSATVQAGWERVGGGSGWRAEYFSNRKLRGSPVLVRTDAALDFNWGWDAPAPGMNRDNFSVRWSGTFPFEAGRYRFTTTTDDGVRLYVDDQLILDAWRPMRGTRSGYVTLSQGNHAVRVEYFERSQAAMARVTWQQVSATSVVSPRPTPAPGGTCAGGPLRLDAWPVGRECDGGGWKATIFVEGRGGDCRYTYAWEREVRGGPTPGSMTFELRSASRGTAIVGEASVTSAGQTVVVGLHVRPPADCH